MPFLTPEKWQEYVDGWREARVRRKKQMDARARQALSAARSLAGLLAEDPAVVRVWLFGSLALYLKGQREYRADSDIDLAVEGLPAERFFPVLSLLNEKSPRPVDLVDISACSPSVRQSIIERGLLLYERPGTTADSGQ
ncbi:nucleotidyltransferase family protein [Desulfofundulus thermosubterraneus]|uniref:Polymerase beta nucleotidyltransferase domain-containing protein n=1 Tax=Desulfofundulus thermosubterraneus DSM 16057 TaxID=1121432 RepID=A0A1M6E8S5_9FIRM|nr:nucleotidyltransferase domain-containing protein [Desulfofundulus thermosubterraneus]SHI81841.1 hypothetical protein SAMN02745219_01147 [Desulfofundulus thermosubterraneus DSM 16057]